MQTGSSEDGEICKGCPAFSTQVWQQLVANGMMNALTVHGRLDDCIVVVALVLLRINCRKFTLTIRRNHTHNQKEPHSQSEGTTLTIRRNHTHNQKESHSQSEEITITIMITATSETILMLSETYAR